MEDVQQRLEEQLSPAVIGMRDFHARSVKFVGKSLTQITQMTRI